MAGKPSIPHDDLNLATNMVLGSIYHGDGINKLVGMVKSAGPEQAPAALAHGLYINMASARHQLEKNQMPVDGRIWTARGGVVDRVVHDTAGLIASNFGPQFNSSGFKKATREQLLQIMQQQDSRRLAYSDDEMSEPVDDEQAEQGLMAPTGEME